MNNINKQNVKLKNMLGILIEPNIYDLLYEIVAFLEAESRMDGVFNMREVSLKTKVRISASLIDDINILIDEGYIEMIRKNTTYKIIKHRWE